MSFHFPCVHDGDSVGLRLGESRHNLHHADPTSARHGVDRGQNEPSAAVIRLLERLGWVYDVRQPTPASVAARRA